MRSTLIILVVFFVRIHAAADQLTDIGEEKHSKSTEKDLLFDKFDHLDVQFEEGQPVKKVPLSTFCPIGCRKLGDLIKEENPLIGVRLKKDKVFIIGHKEKILLFLARKKCAKKDRHNLSQVCTNSSYKHIESLKEDICSVMHFDQVEYSD